MNNGTSDFANGLIWFGAAISIAEILTGTYLAPLGFANGIIAIIIGHLIGAILLYFAGMIGARTNQNAMATVQLSFGHQGSKLFAGLNAAQLLGWTGIMIFDGTLAAQSIWSLGHWQWCLIIGVLILIWLLVGLNHLERLNTLAIGLLLLLTLWLSISIFTSHHQVSVNQPNLSFGAAIELVIAMPLSWLPLISDYTSKATQPRSATWVSVIAYTLGSCWMTIIGMSATILTGQTNIAKVMLHAGLGIAGLLIVIFSTVTTTFMDAYSAGISSTALSSKLNSKYTALLVTIIGTLMAIFLPMDNITPFLYLIDSVFTPMIAIQITDYFILRHTTRQTTSWTNLVIWLLGFIIYRLLMRTDSFWGNTVPDIIIVILITLAVNLLPHTKKYFKSL